MKELREQREEDVKLTFLNLKEFGEIHKIGERELPILIDNNERIKRPEKESLTTDGMYLEKILFYVAREEYGALPPQGRILLLDGKPYTVLEAIDEGELYSMVLEVNQSWR